MTATTTCDEPGDDAFERAPLEMLTDVDGVDDPVIIPAGCEVIDCAEQWIMSDITIDLEDQR